MAFTYFFRDVDTLRAIERHAIPQLKGRRYINVWDAGCAMGPEPYSLAIIFRENVGPFLFRNIKIHASDVDGSDRFGAIIAEGTYPHETVKRIPADLLRKHFSLVPDRPGQFRIDAELMRAVCYQRHDLLSLKPIRSGFGMVVCKNVLLHFKPEQRVDVINMFHSALASGGFLAFEQTQELPARNASLFERVAADAQLFQKPPA
jgi:chemotaxis protein methyltransferase CheR